MNFEQKITKETKAARTPLCLLRCLLFKTAFFLCIFQSAFASSAQPPPQTENRFLFIPPAGMTSLLNDSNICFWVRIPQNAVSFASVGNASGVEPAYSADAL